MASSPDDVRSACGHKDDSESWSGQSSSSLSDDQSEDDSNSQQGASRCHRAPRAEPCRFYNAGGCRNSNSCPYLHVCKFSWKGSCRNGHSCALRHIVDSDSDEFEVGRHSRNGGRRNPGGTTGIKRRSQRRSPSSDSELDDDDLQGLYRWQLDCGHGWKDIANDHILEAQYSRPCAKGIKIYNTAHGAISIDLKNMCVLKKTNLRVRRLGSRQDKWLWYYRGDHRWYQYGEKGAKENHCSVRSSLLETEYQKNKNGSYRFSVGSDTYEIRFKNMCQKNLSTGHMRKVRRRPLYQTPQSHGGLTPRMRMLNLSMPSRGPRWQFSGKGDQWHDFKNTGGAHTECSVTSDDIEAKYQRNPQGRMTFVVSGHAYELDFSTMTQTNKTTNKTRKIQRV